MDPNANLAEQRRLAAAIIEHSADTLPDGSLRGSAARAIAEDGARLAELVQALDQWIVRGGWPPDAWARGAGIASAPTAHAQLVAALTRLVVHDEAADEREALPNCAELQVARALLDDLDAAGRA